MDVQFLTLVSYDPDRNVSRWQNRQLSPEEKASLSRTIKAAQKAAELAGCFPDNIYIRDERPYEYISYGWYHGGIIWLYKDFAEHCPDIFSFDEAVAMFLHENAHHVQRYYPEYFQRLLAYDPAWDQLLALYPDIEERSWLNEVTADIYALRIMGKHYSQSLYKHYQYFSGKTTVNPDLFPETSEYPSMSQRFELIDRYCSFQVNGEIINSNRIALRVRRSDKEYKTEHRMTKEERAFGGPLHYYQYVTQCRSGYDFIQTLLSVHNQVETISGWGIPSRIRGDKKKKFAQDVMTLMKQLLGSANLYVDEKGIYRNDDLPYGAVRAYRASLTRTALGQNGRIQRIKNELRRIGVFESMLTYCLQNLGGLHHHLQSPSFELQEATRNAEDARFLRDMEQFAVSPAK